ncbi:MAG: hypothetical protein D3922_03260 [Candidatus Electrothrix sp. AR1]|nr:hypothetical protein [Candidatus Electrothrix sp. AR1]
MTEIILDVINKLSIGERWCYGIFLSCVSVLFTGWIMQRLSHHLTCEREKRKELRPDILRFKESFYDQIAMNNGTITYNNKTIEATLRDQRESIKKVMPLLPESHRRKLQKTWDYYTGKTKDNGLRFSPEDWIMTMPETELSKYRRRFQKNFKSLHTCLDDLL